MRPRFLIYLSILAIAILAIIFWLRPKGITTPMPLSETVPPTNQPIGHENSASQNVFRVPLPVYLPVNQQTIVTHKVETPEQARQEIESANVPVEFYGKVIDQDSNTLSGVNIKAVVRHWIMADPVSMLAGSKEIPLEQTSGTDGRFELTGATGDGFDIVSFKKDGYQRESGKRGFGAVGGSYDDPVIFKMWSDNIHEKLITGHKSFQIVPDGRPYFINLTDDTISESGEGDLKVWIQYSNHVVHGQLYDWSAGIEVVNGGLLEEGIGSAMYEAPTDGYVPSFQLQQQIKGGQSGEIGERQFYLKLKNGQEYGQISIDLYAPWNQIPGLVSVQYAINPSGSRVLR
ncbi:MAG: hypothetical protein ACLQUR_04590 [Limisphaerales bacterium]